MAVDDRPLEEDPEETSEEDEEEDGLGEESSSDILFHRGEFDGEIVSTADKRSRILCNANVTAAEQYLEKKKGEKKRGGGGTFNSHHLNARA